ncbi:MAG TPA: ABC transporter ATP-binding protein [Dermatophilaceae bacterium]|jgi:putative ABC transport system ATP-binding protein
MTGTSDSLELRDVTLSFGDGDSLVNALDSVSMTIEPGEFVAVVGPSGSGKSSLLAVSGGLEQPTSGSVRVAGTELTTLKDGRRTALRRQKIGFVFQQSNLLSSLTVRDQLLLIAHLDRSVSKAARQRAGELIESLGLSQHADRRPHQLSGGERQRVGIARALMSSPALLLVDEPTSALDSHRAQDIVALLAELTHRGQTGTVMVTHDTSVLEHVDRVLHMHDGNLSREPAPFAVH